MDMLRLGTAALNLVCGLVIVGKTIALALGPAALLAGLAFVGFGLYRLNLVVRRYVQYRLRSMVGDHHA